VADANYVVNFDLGAFSGAFESAAGKTKTTGLPVTADDEETKIKGAVSGSDELENKALRKKSLSGWDVMRKVFLPFVAGVGLAGMILQVIQQSKAIATFTKAGADILDAIITVFLSPLFPIFSKLLSSFAQLIPGVQKISENLLGPIAKLLEPLADFVGKGLFTVLKTLQVVLEIIYPVLNKLWELLGGPLKVIFGTISKVLDSILPILEWLKTKLGVGEKTTSAQNKAALKGAQGIVEAVPGGKIITGAVKTTRNLLRGVPGGSKAVEGFDDFLDKLASGKIPNLSPKKIGPFPLIWKPEPGSYSESVKKSIFKTAKDTPELKYVPGGGWIQLLVGFMKGSMDYLGKISQTKKTSAIPAPAATPRIPSKQSGSWYIPRDMLAFLHQGEAVVPAKYNKGNEVINNIKNINNTRDINNVKNVSNTRDIDNIKNINSTLTKNNISNIDNIKNSNSTRNNENINNRNVNTSNTTNNTRNIDNIHSLNKTVTSSINNLITKNIDNIRNFNNQVIKNIDNVRNINSSVNKNFTANRYIDNVKNAENNTNVTNVKNYTNNRNIAESKNIFNERGNAQNKLTGGNSLTTNSLLSNISEAINVIKEKGLLKTNPIIKENIKLPRSMLSQNIPSIPQSYKTSNIKNTSANIQNNFNITASNIDPIFVGNEVQRTFLNSLNFKLRSI